ncbi:hypothetical protein BpHYR1_014728 [Brachionus plicatilis]|uniref:Uncharacterized protein n=1 Tax=Brachionus plicatilis TaxID=10195 RepID=A0A3M7T741_BRAPC|nr:hypothetical protein BpHYR1_014728 [Brachionus plicatilis]
MSSYPVSQSYGGLGNYSGQYKSGQAQPSLARYGQSLSSENLDFANCAPSYAPSYNCGYQQAPAYTNYCNQLDANDPRLLQQIDQIIAGLVDCKRPILRRQVITVPSPCPGRVAYVTRRLPTPPPDIIERITVVKPPRDVVNLCIEKPNQPNPCYQEKNICGKPRKPIIQPRIISVNPRCNPCPPPPCAPCPPQSYNPCPPPSGNPCAPSSYPQQGQSYQAQVPLSPSPSGSNLSQDLSQPTVTQQPAYTQQGYTQQSYNPSSAYQAPAAYSQALTQQAYPTAAYSQTGYQQAPPGYSQQPAYSQQGAYAQQAYSQPSQGYYQQQPQAYQ